MTSTEALVQLLSQAAPKQKIYPDVVPAEVQPPFVAYSEESQSNTTFDGNGGDVDTTVVTGVAQTKREARELADRVVGAVDGKLSEGYAFYFQGRKFVMYADERLSSYELTFNIL